MKYTVTWHRFPNGKETDEMTANRREFETFEKALAFFGRQNTADKVYSLGRRLH